MKSKILSIFTILAAAIGCVSCDDHNYGVENAEKGKISFADFGVSVETTQQDVSSRDAVDVSQFIVKITNAEGRVVEQKPYGMLPEVITLDAGEYNVMVISHEIQKVEFERPYYEGERKITVRPNEVSDAGTVVCKFASIRVSVTYEANLVPFLGDDVEVRVKANDAGFITFTKDEERSAYFEYVEGSTTLVAVLEGTINGAPQTLRKSFGDLKPGQHRKIHFKVKNLPSPPQETGGIEPGSGIQIDAEVIDENVNGSVNPGEDNLDDKDRPGSNETPDDTNPTKPDDPTPPADDLITISSSTFDVDVVNPVEDGKSYIVDIHSVNPITNLEVEIISESLNADTLEGVGLASKFDLAHPGALAAPLRNDFHFPIEEEVVGHNDVTFDISPFVPLLSIYSGEDHSFKITVTDSKGNKFSKTITFKA